MLHGADSACVESCDQALALIEVANRNRVTSATSMNDSSSRSHSVLVLDVQTKRDAKTYQAKLHLVDLAGSERVKKSEVTGQAFDEACFINNSLTCLGRCVQALAAAGQKGSPKPPFRETKLTRLLSGAFGGRANTALCVCVAPSSSDAFETLNSLQFGQQAMSVKVRACNPTHASLQAHACAPATLACSPTRAYLQPSGEPATAGASQSQHDGRLRSVGRAALLAGLRAAGAGCPHRGGGVAARAAALRRAGAPARCHRGGARAGGRVARGACAGG